MTGQDKRTAEAAQLARIYDDEIAPYWGARFGKLLLRELVVPAGGQVLEVACGTGGMTLELVRRLREGARLIAIDESGAMLDAVRRKLAAGPSGAPGAPGLPDATGKQTVFMRSESAHPKLSFADDVYDLVVSNLGLAAMPSGKLALRDFARVTRPGGEVRCTLPLAGTFEQFHDLYREVLLKHDRRDALDRLGRHMARYPTAERAEGWLAAAGLTGRVEVEEYSLLFRSAHELLFAPVIEHGPLAAWKAIAGSGQDMQDVFWHIKHAFGAYFAGGAFHLTVRAGCLIGRKLEATRAQTTLAHAAREIDPDDAVTASAITVPIPVTGEPEVEEIDAFADGRTDVKKAPDRLAD